MLNIILKEHNVFSLLPLSPPHLSPFPLPTSLPSPSPPLSLPLPTSLPSPSPLLFLSSLSSRFSSPQSSTYNWQRMR